MSKKQITETNPRNFAGFLLEAHSPGGFRDSTDVGNAQARGVVTIDLCIDLLTQFEGTIEEKVEFLKKSRAEIVKFHAKK